MSRNGSGVYTKVNTFVAGNPVTAAGHNQNMDDLAAEMTNSVAADGQTSLTGPLKAASGTVGAPGITFASDPDSGLYRIGSNNVGLAVNGAKVLDVATTGLGVTGVATATTSFDAPAIKQSGFNLLPVGVTLPYAGTAAPTGYLFCFGQSLLRTDYAALFTAIGTTYGAADGTHFTLPDLRGRVLAGKDDMGGSSANRLTNADDGLNGDTLGATGGGETQVLVTGNLPAYTPAGTATATAPNGQNFATATGLVNISTAGGGSPILANPLANSSLATVAFAGTAQGGTSTAFGVVQPTFIVNYIIFAGI